MARETRRFVHGARLPRWARRLRTAALWGMAFVLLTSCEGPEAFLDTAGPDASSIAWLWWVMFALGLAVYVVVLALVGVPIWRARHGRREPGDEVDDARVERRLLVGGGLIGTTIVLFALYLVSLPVLVGVAPGSSNPDEVTVEVTAHQFWWQVHYPDHGGFVTANEITIPAGEPVRFRLTSADVVHSFWIPRLHGKVDMTPGHTTELVVEADEAGHFRGRCTEYCGLGHAHMILHVFAHEREQFDAWVTAQNQPADEPTTVEDQRGRDLFMSACARCHTIRGLSPQTAIGPDLTHFADRETLGAGIVPITPEHLRTWILDPRALKPGAPMPGTPLTDEQMDDLVGFLESLE